MNGVTQPADLLHLVADAFMDAGLRG